MPAFFPLIPQRNQAKDTSARGKRVDRCNQNFFNKIVNVPGNTICDRCEYWIIQNGCPVGEGYDIPFTRGMMTSAFTRYSSSSSAAAAWWCSLSSSSPTQLSALVQELVPLQQNLKRFLVLLPPPRPSPSSSSPELPGAARRPPLLSSTTVFF